MAVPFWVLDSTTGYSGSVYPLNPYDLVILGGQKLPGLCKIKALPSQEISRQKVPGRDGATIIWKGYVPGPIDLECLMWLDEQWQVMQQVIARVWQKPGKDLAAKGSGGTKKESAKSLDQAVALAEKAAMDIVHPYLQVVGITRVILAGISLPEEGPAPQSRTINFKLLEYVPPGKKSALKKAKGALPTVQRSPELQKALNAAAAAGSPGKTEAGPYGPNGLLKSAPPAKGSS